MQSEANSEAAAYYTEALGTQPAPLVEHQCAGEPYDPFVVHIEAMGEGAQLSCETPADKNDDDNTYTINPPNKCILLCDNHLGMVIEGRLDDIEGVFKFYGPEADSTETIDSNAVNCWGR